MKYLIRNKNIAYLPNQKKTCTFAKNFQALNEKKTSKDDSRRVRLIARQS